MYYLQLDVRHYLELDGWFIRWEQKCVGSVAPFREIWWLQKRREPVGRIVLVGFRNRLEWDSEVVVRPSVPPGGVEVEVAQSSDELQMSGGQAFLDALEFFRDPNSWEDKQHADWSPPQHWRNLNWADESSAESVWHKWPDGRTMLGMVLHNLTERKQRLLCCALCRRLPLAMLHARNVLAVETAERYAEGLVPRRDMKKAARRSDLRWLFERLPINAVDDSVCALEREVGNADVLVREAIREVVSNPFCPIEPRREWLRNNGGAGGHLLTAIVNEGRFDDLPILADALEDAGCAIPVILEHLRQGSQHNRGCWVVDLLCGKPETVAREA